MRSFFFLLTLVSLTSSPVHARSMGPGIGGGGGGGAILCPSASGMKAELVDLVESAFYDKISADQALALLPWREQVKVTVDRVAFADPEFHALLVKRVRYVVDHLDESLKETKGTDLIFPAPQDLSHGRLPPMRFGCQLVGAAVFNDSNVDIAKLTISDFIWQAFSEQHKAALVMHESVYLTHRDMLRNLESEIVADSSATRAMVGYLFSAEAGLEATREARGLFASSFAYRSPKLNGRTGRFLGGLMPYNLRGKERTLFLDRKACSAGYFTVLVTAPDATDVSRCQLRSVVNKWPARFEIQTIPVHAAGDASLEFRYSMREQEMLEELRLVCPAGGLNRYNPGFRLACGEETLAEVPGSERNPTTGIAIRLKKDFATFLEDFSF